MIQSAYSKTVQIVIQSRIFHDRLKTGGYKLNEWFNITTHNYECLKEEMSIWNSTITQKPLVINIYLETTEPKLFYECHKIDSNRILIESWTLTLSHPLAHIPVDLPDLIIKLKTSYREYCPLDTKTLLPYIILDINRQQQQEERKRKNISPRPTSLSTNTTTVSLVSSRSSSTTASNSYNSSMPQSLRGNNFINLSERRVSNPVISPFKSPSLSASPQPELTYSQTLERVRVDCRKIEFSSSFERHKNNKISPTVDINVKSRRRGSRASNNRSIYMEDNDLNEFMKFTGEKQELKLFQQHSSLHCTPKHPDAYPIQSKQSLSHFRDVQEKHNSFSLNTQGSQDHLVCHITPVSQPIHLEMPSPVPTNKHNPSKLFKRQSAGDDTYSYLRYTANASPKARENITHDDDDSLLFKMSELGEEISEVNQIMTKDYSFHLKKNRNSINRGQ
ncbi:hypothetical protein G6F46_008765 [Rhizopus delemar]|uniref:Autophagy-related protein 13 n=2 Tax=Rhizopus TaxID=4842 RepID=A0A9P6Z4A8_9FUNG|nr:hypothetical protein G6F55_007823 [Rhizopus delemar]KAG1539636.1 hypothetical protein G6F51_009012 [Rhizopus arrhizus]KAG1496596.1 hypothetical protein G6F54_006358 [Rhizopus delemar]KAG1507956.1 hypothetical protein G6F53_008557 [Rhizopus delemar]KAG1508488.1 hypothetical protein G6F52_011379 [Rhizopus delemar]